MHRGGDRRQWRERRYARDFSRICGQVDIDRIVPVAAIPNLSILVAAPLPIAAKLHRLSATTPTESVSSQSRRSIDSIHTWLCNCRCRRWRKRLCSMLDLCKSICRRYLHQDRSIGYSQVSTPTSPCSYPIRSASRMLTHWTCTPSSEGSRCH